MKAILCGIISMVILIMAVADSNDDGYLSADYCGSYLCSKYSNEAAAYLNDRCLGNFEDYVNLATTEVSSLKVSGGTSINSVILLGLCIFSVSFAIGICSTTSRKVATEKSAELQKTVAFGGSRY